MVCTAKHAWYPLFGLNTGLSGLKTASKAKETKPILYFSSWVRYYLFGQIFSLIERVSDVIIYNQISFTIPSVSSKKYCKIKIIVKIELWVLTKVLGLLILSFLPLRSWCVLIYILILFIWIADCCCCCCKGWVDGFLRHHHGQSINRDLYAFTRPANWHHPWAVHHKSSFFGDAPSAEPNRPPHCCSGTCFEWCLSRPTARLRLHISPSLHLEVNICWQPEKQWCGVVVLNLVQVLNQSGKLWSCLSPLGGPTYNYK